MKRLCGWCGQELDPKQTGDHDGITHGVCSACRQMFFPLQNPEKLDSEPLESDAEKCADSSLF